MPEPAAIGDLFQVRIVGAVEGQTTNNVLNFICVGASVDVETDLVDKLGDLFETHVKPVASSAWALQNYVWKKTGPVLGPEFTTPPDSGGAGGGSAAALPSYSSAVISIRTTRGGKSGRGRMYVPGIPEDQTANSFLNTGGPYFGGLQAFAAAVFGEFKVTDPPVGQKFQFGVYSRKIGGGTFPYTGAGFAPVISMFTQSLIGTTRSRKVGRGS